MTDSVMFTFVMQTGAHGEFINKVKTIKGYRGITGAGLNTAKAFVERVQAMGEVDAPVSFPTNTADIVAMEEGGITAREANTNAIAELRKDLKALAVLAIRIDKLDTAQRLIDVLETL